MEGNGRFQFVERSASERDALLAVELAAADTIETKNEASTMWQTSFNTISIMVGAGLLNLPVALIESGWYGVIMLLCVGALCSCTAGILIRCLDVVRWSTTSPVSYGDVANEAFGRKARWLTTFQVHLSLIFVSMGYLIITSSYVSTLLGFKYATAATVLSVILWLHVFVHSLKELAIFSGLNLALAFWIEAVIMADAMHPSDEAMEESTPSFLLDYPDTSISGMHMRLAFSFSLVVSAFFCHSALPTLYNSMGNPRECAKVIARSQLVCLLLLYLPICALTYAAYGPSLQAPVFMNLRNSMVRHVTILLFSIHLLLSYIVSIYPVQRALENSVLQVRRLSYSTPYYQKQTTCARCSTEDALRFVCRTFVVGVTWALALIFEKMSHGIFVVIIIPIASLALIFPPLFCMKLCWEEMYRWEIARNVFIILIGIWCMVAGFISSVYVVLGTNRL